MEVQTTIKEQIIQLLEIGLAANDKCNIRSIDDYENDNEITITLIDGKQYNLQIYEELGNIQLG